MTNEQTNAALDSVRKHLNSMLEKLEGMKREQEEDLKTVVGAEREKTQMALEQTKKLIEEIKTSQSKIEIVLRGL